MAIGDAVRRVDAVAKVTGRARYTDDFFIPGLSVAKFLRSTIAHGRVKKIDTSKAEDLPGVEAVFTYEDVPQIKFATAGHPYSMDPSHKDVEDRLLLLGQAGTEGEVVGGVGGREYTAVQLSVGQHLTQFQ